MNRAVTELEAVGLALAAYTLWVLADTSLKIVGATKLPAYEVVAVLGLAMMGLLVLRGLARRDLKTLWPKHPRRQVVRGCLDVANNLCVVIALRHLPLAMFYILIFLSPVATTAMAALFLREPLDWRKGFAILLGFGGVVVAVNPLGIQRPGDWVGYLACMVCVLSFSINVTWSRVMARTEAPESLTFFTGLTMAVAGGLATLWRAQPVPGRIGLVLVATAAFGVVGSLCFFTALKHATAATVSQYHYSQLLTGSLLAYAIWRERVTTAMVEGAVLIVGAGVYTALRSRKSKEAEPAAPLWAEGELLDGEGA